MVSTGYLNAEFAPQSVKLQPNINEPKLSSETHSGFLYGFFGFFTFVFFSGMDKLLSYIYCPRTCFNVFSRTKNELHNPAQIPTDIVIGIAFL